MTLSQEQLRVLHARDEIRQVLATYCRAVDRMDRELAASIWHPDARLEYVGVYEGDASGFLDWLWPVHESMEMHSHQVAQSIIEVEGEILMAEIEDDRVVKRRCVSSLRIALTRTTLEHSILAV